MRRPVRLAAVLLLAACARPDAADVPAVAAADPACFGSRVLAYQDLTAEVVIPPGETCESGTFIVFFTRGADTLAQLIEPREGTVGFIGTADVDGDGRGEFFIATSGLAGERRGILHSYTDSPDEGPVRLPLAGLTDAQREGYAGGDRFGFGGTDQLVRAHAKVTGDTVWFAYAFRDARWEPVDRPAWIR